MCNVCNILNKHGKTKIFAFHILHYHIRTHTYSDVYYTLDFWLAIIGSFLFCLSYTQITLGEQCHL